MKTPSSKFFQSCTRPLGLAFLLGVLWAFLLAAPTVAKESGSLQLTPLRTLTSDFIINRLAWHPDNNTLAVGQNLNKKIAIWNIETGQVIRVLDKEAGGVGALAYSPDGKYLAVGRVATRHTPDHAHVHLYDAYSGELVRRFVPPAAEKGDANDVGAIAFSPDSRRLATHGYGGGGVGVVYDLPSGKVVAKLGDGTGILYSLTFSPDGRWLAVGRSDRSDSWLDKGGRQVFYHVGRVELRSTNSWEVAQSITIPSSNIIHFIVQAVTFSPDSKQLVSRTRPAFGGSLDQRTGKWVTPERGDSVKLWNVATTKQVGSLASSHIGGVGEKLQYSMDGKLLFMGGVDKNIEIWFVDSATKLRTLVGFSQTVHFTLNHANTLLATASGEEIKLWELTR